MSLARAALTAFVGHVSTAVHPDVVEVAGGSARTPASVVVLPLALERISRSRRDGPLLDLELRAAVVCSGPRDLENAEALLVACERLPSCTVSVLDASDRRPVPSGLGFVVAIPVSVPLAEVVGPPVREPLRIRTTVGHLLRGTVVGADGRGVPGVRIRGHGSAGTAATDASGRFEVLASQDDVHRLTAELDGTSRTVTVDPRDVPVTIRWD